MNPSSTAVVALPVEPVLFLSLLLAQSMMHETCAQPEVPLQEHSRTSGLPDASGDSERHIQQTGASLMVTVCFDGMNFEDEVEEIFAWPSPSTSALMR